MTRTDKTADTDPAADAIARHRQINQWLQEALELPVEERSAFLSRACGDQRDLLEEVESLLQVTTADLEALDSPVVSAWSSADEKARLGSKLGPYELQGEIGRGGMGEVHLGLQRGEDLDRRVAIKLLKRGLDSDEIVQRFHRERRILAHLEHPNIARLYDGGQSSDHRPYFVMELVEGQSIDRYCDDHQLSIEKRLRLFLKVCDAVRFAHQKLVVHRDLKPSNVLVTEEGTPKLLDFGIAKLLESDGTSTATLTQHGSGLRLMTPQYASPEQIRGGPISTASDVYSLGVLLYQVLSGYRPYRIKQTSEAEIHRLICEQSCPRPSQRLSQAIAHPEREDEGKDPRILAAKRGGLEPNQLKRSLVGDLDAIVIKAMHQDVEGRYGSVEQLMDDLERFLTAQPVRARRATWFYQTSKFIRRNRWRLAAALASFLTFGAYLAEREMNQQRIAQERDRAQAATLFLEEIFKVSNPSWVQTLPTTRELLDRGAARIDRDLSDQPELQAALMTTIGRVYRNLGLYDPADRLLVGALEQKRSVHGDKHLETAMALLELARLRQMQGRHEEAEGLYRETVDLGSSLNLGDRPFVAQAKADLAISLREVGDLDVAETLMREAITTLRSLFGEAHLEVARATNQLAMILQSKGELTTAEELLRQALAIQIRSLGQEHLDVALTRNHLAVILRMRGQYDEARSLFDRVLEVRLQVQGEDHQDVAASLNNLATLEFRMGNHEAAEKPFRRALEIYRNKLDPDHPYLLSASHNLSMVLLELGQLDEAKELELYALKRLRQSRHLTLPNSINHMGAILIAKGELLEAEELLIEALELNRERLGEEHPYFARALHNLGVLRFHLGKRAEAEEHLEQALAIQRQALAEDHPETARILTMLAMLDVEESRWEQAEQRIDRALEVGRKKLTADHWQLALGQCVLGAILTASGDYREAEQRLLDNYQTMLNRAGAASPLRKWPVERLVELYEAWDRPVEATKYRQLLSREFPGKDGT